MALFSGFNEYTRYKYTYRSVTLPHSSLYLFPFYNIVNETFYNFTLKKMI